jgi:hypothetical protein
MKAKGLVMAGVLVLAACSRSGTIFGDIFVQTPSGDVKRAARIEVRAVPSTKAFEREWAIAIAAFQAELEPVLQRQKAAASSAEEAKLEWDKALAARNATVSRGIRRNRSRGPSPRVQELWKQMRAADDALFQAKKRVWEVAVKHGTLGEALLDRHKAQQVQTDADGHYVLPGLPAGKVHLYAQFVVGSQTFTWFRPVQVRRGAQQVDLTQANSGGWPFVP